MRLSNLQLATYLSLLLAWSSLTHADHAAPKPVNTGPVVSRIASFNSHDIESYLLAHHKEVEIYQFPDKPIGVGRAHLRMIFGPMLEKNIGNITIINQTRVGNRVVSDEQISYGPSQEERLVAIYTIENNLIRSIHLIESDR